jgi:uroporphyrinogen decarboxylase
MFPLEIGTWQADPYQFRRQYGQDCLLMGGVDKHILAQDRAAIDAMITHLTPLVEEGGYIPTPDHRVPPDVPLNNYLYFLDRIKEVWGKGLNVRPTGQVGKVLAAS